jgi:hypothetical protein
LIKYIIRDGGELGLRRDSGFLDGHAVDLPLYYAVIGSLGSVALGQEEIDGLISQDTVASSAIGYNVFVLG